MKNILKIFGSLVATFALILSIGYVQSASAAATLRFVQTPSIHLYTGLSSSATTARITPYPKDLDGVKLTFADFGTLPTFTVDPKISGYEEIVSFTGMTDNGDNTATLTGLSRDLTSKYPYVTTGTGRTHGAGATVVFSNNPQMYGRFAAPENDITVTGTWIYSKLPTFSIAPTSGTDGVNKTYADALSMQGGATSTEANIGFVQLSTGTNTGTGVASSTTGQANGGAPIVIENKFATTTPGTLCSTSKWNCIPAAFSATGKLSQSWFDLSATYAWTGLHTFSAGLLTSASSTMNATTTIVANNVNSKALVLNGLAYAFPATQGIQNSVLTNNGSGTLSWTLTGSSLGTTTATTTAMGSGGQTLSEMTLLSMSVPGGSLGTSSVVTWDVPISTLTCSGSTNGCNQTIKIKYGGTTICTITPSFGTVSGGNNQGILRAKIIGNGLTNSQAGSCYFFATIGQQTYGAISGIQLVTTGSSAIDSTASQTFSLTIAISEGSGMISDFGLSVGTVSLAK